MRKPILIALTLVLSLSACAHKQFHAPIADLPQNPAWVSQGSCAANETGQNVFYGVGSANGITNLSLLRTTADNRARAELVKMFDVYSASLMKDYAASTMAGKVDQVSEEQHVEQAIKTVASMSLKGVQIVEHWQDPKTGEMFARAKLDAATFNGNLDRIKDLDVTTKNAIKASADRLHAELNQETAK